MTSYAGLDVSQQGTQICIVDASGAVRWCGKARSEPAAMAAVLRRHAPDLARAVLESGALSGWLCGGLVEAGLPAVCVDARAAHGALKQRRSKTDRGDAEGLARLAQTGWFKIVRLKSRASLERHALLAARERLVRVQRDLLNQVRGLVKPLGLVLPRTTPRRAGWWRASRRGWTRRRRCGRPSRRFWRQGPKSPTSWSGWTGCSCARPAPTRPAAGSPPSPASGRSPPTVS
jgi:transposase